MPPGRSTNSCGRLRSKKRKTSEQSPLVVAAEDATSSPIFHADTTSTTAAAEDGSFVLEVANGQQRIRIAHDQAKILRANSQFFEHAFCHGTLEASSGILSKPDWSLGTAEMILKLLTNGSIPVPSAADLQQLRVAADQILLPFTIPHPVYSHIDLQKKTMILDLVQETRQRCTHSFLLRRCDLTHLNSEDEESIASGDTSVHTENSDDNNRTRLFERKGGAGLGRVDIWLQYLKQGILATEVGKGFRLQLTKKGPEDSNKIVVVPAVDERKHYQVQYSAPLFMIVTHVCCGLRQIREDEDEVSDDETPTSYRMTFQAYCGFYDHLLEITDDLDVCWEGDFNVDGIADDVTVSGSLEDLTALLVHVQDFIIPCQHIYKVALFFHNIGWRMLGRLIHATQQCEDHPNTLLWDSEANDFFTMKTLKDTKTILGLLSKELSPLANNGVFELTEKSGHVICRGGNNWETR